MGVTELWKILAPAQRHVPLEELRGQTLAVDLSIWVVEAEGVAQMKGRVVRPYLRNLFFRIWHLQQHGIRPVFVIEGEAPELKLETMARRQQARFGGPPQTRGAARGNRGGGGGGSRSRFKIWLRECCEMLDSLGIAYVQSKGEAEALCALLTRHGMVDGCITNDGDAFLYGAITVYRNFSTSNKTVEVYRDVDIENNVGLSRDNLVALSLLLGCDFCPGGVPGVGNVIAMKLVYEIGTGESLLHRFKQWRREGTSSMVGPVEAQVRRKALCMPDFPQLKVVAEFTQPKDNVAYLHISWNRPKMFHFQKFMVDKVEWVEEYALAKVLPVLTLYDMMAIKEGKTERQRLIPHSIVKSRVKRGVPMYEMEWNKAPGDHISEGEFYVTLEEQTLVDACYPQLVADYTLSLANAKKGKPSRKKKEASELLPSSQPLSTDDDITTGIESLSLHDRITLSQPTYSARSKYQPTNYNIAATQPSKFNMAASQSSKSNTAASQSSKSNMAGSQPSKSNMAASQPLKSKPTEQYMDLSSSDSDLELELKKLQTKAKAKKKLKSKVPAGLMTFSDDESLMLNATELKAKISVKKKSTKGQKSSVLKKKPSARNKENMPQVDEIDLDNEREIQTRNSNSTRDMRETKTVVRSENLHGLEAISDAMFDQGVEIKMASDDEEEEYLPLTQRLLLRASQNSRKREIVRDNSSDQPNLSSKSTLCDSQTPSDSTSNCRKEKLSTEKSIFQNKPTSQTKENQASKWNIPSPSFNSPIISGNFHSRVDQQSRKETLVVVEETEEYSSTFSCPGFDSIRTPKIVDTLKHTESTTNPMYIDLTIDTTLENRPTVERDRTEYLTICADKKEQFVNPGQQTVLFAEQTTLFCPNTESTEEDKTIHSEDTVFMERNPDQTYEISVWEKPNRTNTKQRSAISDKTVLFATRSISSIQESTAVFAEADETYELTVLAGTEAAPQKVSDDTTVWCGMDETFELTLQYNRDNTLKPGSVAEDTTVVVQDDDTEEMTVLHCVNDTADIAYEANTTVEITVLGQPEAKKINKYCDETALFQDRGDTDTTAVFIQGHNDTVVVDRIPQGSSDSTCRANAVCDETTVYRGHNNTVDITLLCDFNPVLAKSKDCDETVMFQGANNGAASNTVLAQDHYMKNAVSQPADDTAYLSVLSQPADDTAYLSVLGTFEECNKTSVFQNEVCESTLFHDFNDTAEITVLGSEQQNLEKDNIATEKSEKHPYKSTETTEKGVWSSDSTSTTSTIDSTVLFQSDDKPSRHAHIEKTPIVTVYDSSMELFDSPVIEIGGRPKPEVAKNRTWNASQVGQFDIESTLLEESLT